MFSSILEKNYADVTVLKWVDMIFCSSLLSFLEEGRISHLLRQLASQNLPLIIPSIG
jgi:hypothetical protein